MRGLDPFRNRNFSVYFTGQAISLTGSWFQNLALQLVVLQATGSATALSGVSVAQFLPMFVLGIPAGRLVDRVPPRTVLLVTSLLSAAVVAVLALVVSGDDPPLMSLYLLVGLLGCVHAFERVAAQTIIYELIGPTGFGSAVSLSTIAIGVSRSIGPGLAGLVFQAFGPVPGMAVNAASFVVVFGLLLLIRPRSLFERPASAEPEGFSGEMGRSMATVLIVNSAIALLAMNFMVTLTAVVSIDFAGSAATLGAAHALNAAGGIAGGLIAAAIGRMSMLTLGAALTGFGAAILLNAAAPSLILFLVASPLLGAGLGFYQGTLNAIAQQIVPPTRIGRMMSMINVGSYGVVPVGALLTGWLVDSTSGRGALVVAGIGALVAAVLVLIRHRADGAVHGGPHGDGAPPAGA